MYRRSLKILSSALGALVGATACSSGDGDDIKMEYGMPHARVIVDGTVVSAEKGAPIPGIQVSYRDSTATSDSQGHWAIDDPHAYPASGGVSAHDVDGDKNGGHFGDSSVTLTLAQTAPGSGNWDEGTYEQHGVVITMTLAPLPEGGVDAADADSGKPLDATSEDSAAQDAPDDNSGIDAPVEDQSSDSTTDSEPLQDSAAQDAADQ